MAIDRREFIKVGTVVAGAASSPALASTIRHGPKVRRIATEEGFATLEYVNAMAEIAKSDWKNHDLQSWYRIATRPPAGQTDRWTTLRDRFVDLPDARIREMDESGVD